MVSLGQLLYIVVIFTKAIYTLIVDKEIAEEYKRKEESPLILSLKSFGAYRLPLT